MLKITMNFDGSQFEQAMTEEILRAAREEIEQRLRAISCTDHRSSPTVTWTDPADVKGEIRACCEKSADLAWAAFAAVEDENDPGMPEDFTEGWKHSD